MRRDARRRHARSRRGKIVGGKAIARRLNFSQLRELNESTDKQKQPTVAPTRELVCPRSTKRKHRDKTSIPSLAEAYAYNDTLPSPTLEATKTRWRPLGPFCIPHGQTYGSGPGCRPSISGRVSAIAIDPNDPQVLYNVACVYSLTGEPDQAFDILERALPDFAEEFYKWFKNDSDLDPIRSHPRYEKLLRLIE